MYKFAEARKKNKLTQKEVGDYLSVTAATISRYESGDMQPDPQTLIKMATLYHCSVDYLLGIEDNNSFVKIFSAEEIELLLRYRKLTDSQKAMLSDMISIWESRESRNKKDHEDE